MSARFPRGRLAWADVALVAFKGSDLDKYGLGWDRARTINPRLIHLTHLPFGRFGPDADQGGYDVLVQALSGMGFIMNRSENGTPLPSRPAVNDFGTGIASALGVVTALRHRDQTGEGQRVDTALLATALSLATEPLALQAIPRCDGHHPPHGSQRRHEPRIPIDRLRGRDVDRRPAHRPLDRTAAPARLPLRPLQPPSRGR